MSCENVQDLISPLLDRSLSAEEREGAVAHILTCGRCSARYESLVALRSALRSMDTPVPAGLTARLRVLASHEQVRQLSRRSIAARVRHWAEPVQLVFDNLMRPMALPIAGGLVSAIIVFSVLVPNLTFIHSSTDQSFSVYPLGQLVQHVPLSGGALLETSGFAPRILPADATVPPDASNVVELTIDENGRVSDYHVDRGTLTPDVQNIIMFSLFVPATNLGVPVSGKVKVVQVPGRVITGRYTIYVRS